VDGYFNATEATPKGPNGKRIAKPAHFIDNAQVQLVLTRLGKPAIITKGRSGGTLLPVELRTSYMGWLNKQVRSELKQLLLDLEEE